jgi:hypothetical protein
MTMLPSCNKELQIARHHKTEGQSIPQIFNINANEGPDLFNGYNLGGPECYDPFTKEKLYNSVVTQMLKISQRKYRDLNSVQILICRGFFPFSRTSLTSGAGTWSLLI